MNILKVSDYTQYPGPRQRKIGPFSGEDFLEKELLPAAKRLGKELVVDLDNTAGYGSSFLEESFGGLVRRGIAPEVARAIGENLISEEDPTLLPEIREYISDSICAEKLTERSMKRSYKNTRHYKLGKKYKRLGKMLMDEKTDLRDLVIAANELGLRLDIKLKSDGVIDEYALAA